MLNADALRLLKPTCYVINTSRGGVVDQGALAEALMEGRLAGAGLDVLEREPPTPQDQGLLALDQVTFTPHLAWYSEEAVADLQAQAGETVAAVLRGEWPDNIVNSRGACQGAAGSMSPDRTEEWSAWI